MEFHDVTSGLVEKEWHLCNLARKQLTEEWFLTRTIWPSLFFTTTYLLFVTYIGPRFMKNREAFSLKPIVMIFSLLQCAVNTYLWSVVFDEARFKHICKNYCHPADLVDSRQCQKDSFLIWLYYVTKITDLLDTVLFILRKKQSQVTFLHTYHHAIMVPGAWYFGLNLSGTQTIIVGGINAFVHTVMYFYYFLAAFGPSMQKYLWWKIYVTRLQMLQFFSVLTYMGFIIVNQCSLPETMTYPLIAITSTFTILFFNFYIRSYIQRKEKPNNAWEKTKNKAKSSIGKEK